MVYWTDPEDVRKAQQRHQDATRRRQQHDALVDRWTILAGVLILVQACVAVWWIAQQGGN